MKIFGKVIVFASCMLLGIIIATQGRMVYRLDINKKIMQETINDMVAKLEDDKAENENLKKYLEILQKENDILLEQLAISKSDEEILYELKRCCTIAGLTDIIGEGIIITLDDADARKFVDPKSLIIHDVDIRILLNELKAGGALAISVNDERILDISGQICAGPIIIINKNRYSTPYIIKAIGDRGNLKDIITKSERYAILNDAGIHIDIEEKTDITVGRYIGSIAELINGLKVADDV